MFGVKASEEKFDHEMFLPPALMFLPLPKRVLTWAQLQFMHQGKVT